MDKPTKEELRQFWQSCGWEFRYLSDPEMRWKYPDGSEGAWFGRGTRYTTLPDLNMDSIFTDAIPKICDQSYVYTLDEISIAALTDSWYVELVLEQVESKYIAEVAVFEGDGGDPTTALFWACYKALEQRR